jgi:hypothetical protein
MRPLAIERVVSAQPRHEETTGKNKDLGFLANCEKGI